jgi:hypothetical protein
MVPIFATLARMAGTTFEEAVRTATVQQCGYDARTVFRAMFSRREPDRIVACFARFNAQYYDFGTYVATTLGTNRARLETIGVPAYGFVFTGPMHLAYAEEAVRIVGARSPSSQLVSVEPAGEIGGFPLVRSSGELAWR